jgi:CTP synthase (UTP-ammonia lyase)
MTPPIRITVLGDHTPSFITHRALDAALAELPAGVQAGWVATDDPAARHAGDPAHADGLWVAPGSPYRDDDAVLAAIDRARRSGLPLLGTCGGFQYTALVLGAALAGLHAPRHAELHRGAADPFIAALGCRLDGVRRTVTCVPGTRLAALLGEAPFPGFFFCGYAPSAAAAAALEGAGVRVAAHAEDVGPVALELPGHPFLMATLFQVQIGALRGEPLSPLIDAFVQAARDHAGAAAAATAAAPA